LGGSTAWRESRGWRCLLAGLLLLAASFLSFQARAQEKVAPLLLLDANQHPELHVQSGLAWFGPHPLGGISAASDGRLAFTRYHAARSIAFEPGTSFWLKLRLQPAPGSTDQWQLEVPVPVIDSVSLYQQDASGRWFARTAGDLVPMSDWPRAGRYPFFRLQLRAGAPTEVFIEVRHSTPLALPLRIVTSAVHYERTQVEYLGLGLVMGSLALLVLASLLRAATLRDAAYGWYAAFALTAMLALAAYTGVAAHLLWGDAGLWVDVAPGVLAALACSITMLIVGRLSSLFTRIRWLARMLHVLGWLGVLLALFFVLLDRSTGLALLGAYIVAVAGVSLQAAGVTWRRDDPVGLWLLVGSVPLVVSVLLALGRVVGWLEPAGLAEYGLVLALTFNLPMLFGALNSRSEERRSVELRRIAAENQDPLTGLMKRGPFIARLRQALARHERRGEGAAIAVIELANHEWIQKTRGAEAAEEALLRSVIKLRSLVRDVDTTGRLGENRFGLILEGVPMRKPMAGVAARLVASGLMEEPGRPRDVMLHFHVAAVVLHEHAAPAEDLLQTLADLLQEMGPRTQRPVRFVEQGAAPSTVADFETPEAGSASDMAPA
jgi:two-component system, sensor histidine kinase LadS